LLLLFPTPIAPDVEIQPKVINTQPPKQEPKTVQPSRHESRTLVMEVTAYCNCYQCTGKHPSDKGYGITATGTKAGKGTVAADFSVLPPGTRLSIPGYGEGIVSDKGGSIRGNRLDVWFPSHDEALKWGRRRVKIIKEGAK
jgi:3D (Asp-Asp-Asp) domain-containing protein